MFNSCEATNLAFWNVTSILDYTFWNVQEILRLAKSLQWKRECWFSCWPYLWRGIIVSRLALSSHELFFTVYTFLRVLFLLNDSFSSSIYFYVDCPLWKRSPKRLLVSNPSDNKKNNWFLKCQDGHILNQIWTYLG